MPRSPELRGTQGASLRPETVGTRVSGSEQLGGFGSTGGRAGPTPACAAHCGSCTAEGSWTSHQVCEQVVARWPDDPQLEQTWERWFGQGPVATHFPAFHRLQVSEVFATFPPVPLPFPNGGVALPFPFSALRCCGAKRLMGSCGAFLRWLSALPAEWLAVGWGGRRWGLCGGGRWAGRGRSLGLRPRFLFAWAAETPWLWI